MTTNTTLIEELKRDSAKTQTMLAGLPDDKFGWKPHDKSYAIDVLAQHIANLPTWIKYTLTQDELDFANPPASDPKMNSTKEILALHRRNVDEALQILENTPEEEFQRNWTLRHGEHVIFTLPKIDVLRDYVYNHTVHHRAQLGVNLRLLDIPVPGMFGPTADEK